MSAPIGKPQIVICRQASDPLLPGSIRGYCCRQCGREITASPGGQDAIRDGGIPMCNRCGQELLEKLTDAPNAPGVDLVIGPRAQQQMRAQGFDPEDLVRKKKP